MNNWDAMSIMAREHCDDLLREALTEQMLREAFKEDRRQRSLRCRLLCKVGRALAAAGIRLQEMYGSPAEAAVPG
jgi:anti-sigma factor RsiW